MDQQGSLSEIEQLIDELEAYAEKSPFWAGPRVLIPDEDFFRITQQIRELLPQELDQARKTLDKRDLILKNAQEEHRRIIESAERRLEDLTSEEAIVQIARERADQIESDARQDAEGIRRESLSYTAELLADMQKQFEATRNTIRNGREFIESEINSEVSQNMAAIEASDANSEEQSGSDEESGA
jgi:vacuolar-type H+-ATPase subunit H